MVLYKWRHQFEDFAERWDHATAEAADKLEEVVYGLALSGDLPAAQHWLKHHWADPYDRATLLKLGLLQASLAAQRNGAKVIDVGPDGWPLASSPMVNGKEAKVMPLDGSAMELIHVAYIPDNGRDGLVPPVCDGSGRAMPLPRRCMVIQRANGVVMRMSADGHAVPSGAVPKLWARIKAYNELCASSGPVRAAEMDAERIARVKAVHGALATMAQEAPAQPTTEKLEILPPDGERPREGG